MQKPAQNGGLVHGYAAFLDRQAAFLQASSQYRASDRRSLKGSGKLQC